MNRTWQLRQCTQKCSNCSVHVTKGSERELDAALKDWGDVVTHSPPRDPGECPAQGLLGILCPDCLRKGIGGEEKPASVGSMNLKLYEQCRALIRAWNDVYYPRKKLGLTTQKILWDDDASINILINLIGELVGPLP